MKIPEFIYYLEYTTQRIDIIHSKFISHDIRIIHSSVNNDEVVSLFNKLETSDTGYILLTSENRNDVIVDRIIIFDTTSFLNSNFKYRDELKRTLRSLRLGVILKSV